MTQTPQGTVLKAVRVPVRNLANTLQSLLGRPVIDKTTLEGFFDVELRFSSQNVAASVTGVQEAADAPFPSLFTAVQEQRGFKLESARGPGDVLVIETIKRPTDN